MSRRTRSARGEVVDFDLISIKEQMAAAVPPVSIAQRENLIDKRMKRRLKTAATAAMNLASESVVDSTPIATAEEPSDLIDATPEETLTKQKARKKVTE